MIDFIILTILALCILAGYYRGVLYSAISLGISAVAFILPPALQRDPAAKDPV